MNKFPFYFQNATYDCVPACVLAMASYYQNPLSLRYIRSLLVTDPATGTVLKNVYQLKEHFHVTIGRIEDLSELPVLVPFVAYLKQNHAVVVWSIDLQKNRLTVGDPAVGLHEVSVEDLLLAWDRVAVILRPFTLDPKIEEGFSWPEHLGSFLHIDDLRMLRIHWGSMGWVSLLVSASALLNAFYSIYFVDYIAHTRAFMLFVLSYGAISLVLAALTSLVQNYTVLHYAQRLGYRMEDVLGQIDLRFYTMGDVSTRYQDVLTVIGSILGLFRDVPYSLVIFAASFYFLAKISWLLAIFAVAFLVFMISLLTPLVQKMQRMMYQIRLMQGEMTNKLRHWLSGGENEVSAAWSSVVHIEFKQSMVRVPMQAIMSNAMILPTVFVVVFLHWQQGYHNPTSQAMYAKILSAIMMMSYAVSAGHGLYSRIVGWQMAIPSLQRLRDFFAAEDYVSETFIASHQGVARSEGMDG